LIGDDYLDALTQPVGVLMQTLASPRGFRHRDIRSSIAQLLGRALGAYGASQVTYDHRRPRLHPLIEHGHRSHRSRITESGARLAVVSGRIATDVRHTPRFASP
jgi:hypothetical protein